MKKIFTLLLFPAALSAQNLVPNPGFEIQDSCPAVSELFVCKPWGTPTLGTPDAFSSSCPTQNISAHTGVGSAGIYMYSTFPDNREYMQVALTSPLTGGQTYYVSFWVKRSNYRYAVNRVGAYFSTGALNLTSTSVLPYSADVENPVSNMLTNGWRNIAGTYVASGGEDNIIIGNFSDDNNTDTLVANSGNTSKIAYYQVDDISVTLSGNGVNDIYGNGNMINVFPNPSNGKFSLATNGLKRPEIKIYNSLGEIVYGSSATGTEIDMTASPKGVYFIRMNSEEGSAVKKLVIE